MVLWISSSPKSNKDIQLCVVLTSLNKSVRREIHLMVQENLAKIQTSKFFSKLDTYSGFWKIPLDPSSRLLTTFITSFGLTALTAYLMALVLLPDSTLLLHDETHLFLCRQLPSSVGRIHSCKRVKHISVITQLYNLEGGNKTI